MALFAAVLLWTGSAAQGQSFTTTWGGALAQYGIGVIPSDTGHTVVGCAFTGERHRAFLWRFDAAGDLQSTHEVDMAGRLFIQAIAPIPGGGAYCVGSVIMPSGHEHDGLLMRIGSNNTVAWIHHPNVPGDQQYLGVSVMPDGGAVVCGVSRTGVNKDVLLQRFGPGGQQQWSVIEDMGSNEEFLAVAVNDAGIMATGRIMSFGGTSDALFAHYTLSGTQNWLTAWGGAGDDMGRALVARADGSFVMAGGTTSTGPIDPAVNRVRERVYLIGIDAQGDTLWTRSQGQVGKDLSAHCLIVAPNGDLLIGGQAATSGLSDGLLQRYTTTGTLLWERTTSTGRAEKIHGIASTATGLVATGWSFGPDGNQVLLTRRNANGD
jgi:hypothetical protein